MPTLTAAATRLSPRRYRYTAADYQRVRALWEASLRGIGLNPRHLPEDFSPRQVAREMRDAGLPTLSEIARRTGISIFTVWSIARGGHFHPDEA